MSDLFHKTTFSALTGVFIFLSVFNISGQMPDFSVTDSRNSKVYPIVHIGYQWWMAQNLDIGTMIPSTTEMADNSVIEKYCIENNSAYCDTFGGIYSWDELMQYTATESTQGICPAGWHIPSDDEWKSLEAALGMPQASIDSVGWRGTVEGGMLKQVGTEFWFEPNVGATNEVGFNLLPAGGRIPDGTIGYNGEWTDFWTSTQYSQNDSFAYWRWIHYSNSDLFRSNLGYKPNGTSVRCLKNTPDYYETSEFTDVRDANVYKTVLIGEQWWMADNLNVGERINTLEQQTSNPVIEKYCYNNDDAMCETFGGLYQWDEMMQYTSDNNQGICPDGWRLPSDDDWKQLERTLEMDEGEINSTGWNRGTFQGIFLNYLGGSGFDAMLGGVADPSSSFNNLGAYGYYWSSNQFDENYSWGRAFGRDSATIARNNYYHKRNAFSVRCIMSTNTQMETEIIAPETVCPSQEFNITAQVSGGTGSYSYSWASNPPGTYPGEISIPVSPVTDTKYYLTVNDGESTVTDSVLVVVNPLPSFNIVGPEIVCAGEKYNSYSTASNSDYQYDWSTVDGQITTSANVDQINVDWGTVTGTKTLNLVIDSKTTGCRAEKKMTVESLPEPVFNVTGPTEVCSGAEGSTYTADYDQSFTYDWQTNNGVITTAPTISQIEVNWELIPGTKILDLEVIDSPNGCHAHKQVNVEVKPSPEKPEMVRKATSYIFICTDSGQIYQWYHDGSPISGETKQFYYARNATDRNGTISVEISSENGCKNESEPFIFSDKSSSYHDDLEPYRAFVHPNPNNGLVAIEIFDDYTGQVDIEICNSLGQIVRRVQIPKPLEILENELDLRQLSSGVYMLIFKFGMNREIHRIIINSTN